MTVIKLKLSSAYGVCMPGHHAKYPVWDDSWVVRRHFEDGRGIPAPMTTSKTFLAPLPDCPIAWFHAPEENAEHYSDVCTSREQAVANARAEYGPKATFWVRTGHQPEASRYMPDANDLRDIIAERSYDEAGDAAEDFPDFSDEAESELSVFLEAWATKHLKVSFWVVDGAPEKVEAVTSDVGGKS